MTRLTKEKATSSNSEVQNTRVGPGVIAILTRDFGYSRIWNFRCPLGFAALGLTKNKVGAEAAAADNNGVLFQLLQLQLDIFYKREVGLVRIRIPFQYTTMQEKNAPVRDENETSSLSSALITQG